MNQQMIADYLNVSTATVSRSLRNHPSISASMRAKVLETASRLGYQAPKGQKSPRAARNRGLLGIFVPGPSDHGQQPVMDRVEWHHRHHLAGMCEAAQRIDATCTIHFIAPDNADRLLDRAYQPAALVNGDLAGLALLGNYPREVLAGLSQQLPCVTIGVRYPDLRIDSIDAQSHDAIEDVVDHLHSLGHRRIAFHNGFARRSWVDDRVSGFIAAMIRRDLPFDPASLVNYRDECNDPKQQFETVHRLVRDRGVTAVVCANDYAAFNLINEAKAVGLSVPGDFSVTGFDAIPSTFGVTQTLTSVRFPYHEMGAAIVRRLFERQRDPAGEVRHIQFRCHFIAGETTGPAPSHSTST